MAATILEWIVLPIFPACFLLFFMTFPKRHAPAQLRVLIFVPGIAIAGINVISIFQPNLYDLGTLLSLSVLLVYLLLGVGLSIYSFVTLPDPSARIGLAIIEAGTAASVLPFAALFLVPVLMAYTPLMAPERAILPLALLPVSFTYAILKYKALKVSLLQRWLVQGGTWLGLMTLYATVVYAMYRLLDTVPEPTRSISMAAVLTLFIGTTFARLRIRLRSGLESVMHIRGLGL